MNYPIYKIKSISRKNLIKTAKQTPKRTKDKLSIRFAIRILDEYYDYL